MKFAGIKEQFSLEKQKAQKEQFALEKQKAQKEQAVVLL